MMTPFNSFQPSVAFHIENSHLIWTANQMTGFYMKRNIGLKWVKLIIKRTVRVSVFTTDLEQSSEFRYLCLGPYQTSMMRLFTIVKSLKLLNIFTKSSTIDFWEVRKYASLSSIFNFLLRISFFKKKYTYLRIRSLWKNNLFPVPCFP